MSAGIVKLRDKVTGQIIYQPPGYEKVFPGRFDVITASSSPQSAAEPSSQEPPAPPQVPEQAERQAARKKVGEQNA